MSERREPASIERAAVRRGGRRERACHALPLDMAGARALVAACWSWWWLTIAAGEYLLYLNIRVAPTLLLRRSADRTAVYTPEA